MKSEDNLEVLHYSHIAWQLLISVCFAFGVSVYSEVAGIGFWFLFLALIVFSSIVLFVFLKQVFIRTRLNIRVAICAGIFSLCFSLALFLGKSIYETGSFALYTSSFLECLKWVFATIGMWVFISIICYCLFLLINKFSDRLSQSSSKSFTKLTDCRLRYIAIATIATFLFWLPYYLALWPGTFSYDIFYQTQYIFNDLWGAKHPPLHTAFWCACIHIGNLLNINPMVIYAITQMFAMSLSCSIFSYVLARNIKKFAPFIYSSLFFALNPVIAIFSFIPTKDALFGVFFLQLVASLIPIVLNKENISEHKVAVIIFSISALLCCLLRNNFIYAFILFIIILLIFVKGKSLLGSSIVLVLASFFFITRVIYPSIGIVDGPIGESLSVPTQQLVWTVKDNPSALTPEEKDKLAEYINIEKAVERFNPRFSDPIRVLLNTEERVSDFIKLWIDVGINHPTEYFEAFLDLNIPYWYPFASTIDDYSDREYIEIGDADFYGFTGDSALIHRDSKLPLFNEYVNDVASYKFVEHLPFLNPLFSINFPIWFMLFDFFLILSRKKQYRSIAILTILPILFFATYLLGPVSNFRYIFPIYLLYPFFLTLIIYNFRSVDRRHTAVRGLRKSIKHDKFAKLPD